MEALAFSPHPLSKSQIGWMQSAGCRRSRRRKMKKGSARPPPGVASSSWWKALRFSTLPTFEVRGVGGGRGAVKRGIRMADVLSFQRRQLTAGSDIRRNASCGLFRPTAAGSVLLGACGKLSRFISFYLVLSHSPAFALVICAAARSDEAKRDKTRENEKVCRTASEHTYAIPPHRLRTKKPAAAGFSR